MAELSLSLSQNSVLVCQGGVLSPYLFTRYITDMIHSVGDVGVGCFVGGQFINILAYADDIVVVALSWRTMQLLLSVLNAQSVMLDLSCNANKTVCMVFTLKSRNGIVSSEFPHLKIGKTFIRFLDSFKYLQHYTGWAKKPDSFFESLKLMYTLT